MARTRARRRWGRVGDITDPEALAERQAFLDEAKRVYIEARLARPREERRLWPQGHAPAPAPRPPRAPKPVRPAGEACGPPDPVTGTPTGASRHRTAKEPICEPCAEAERARVLRSVNAWRARRLAEDAEAFRAEQTANQRAWRKANPEKVARYRATDAAKRRAAKAEQAEDPRSV